MLQPFHSSPCDADSDCGCFCWTLAPAPAGSRQDQSASAAARRRGAAWLAALLLLQRLRPRWGTALRVRRVMRRSHSPIALILLLVAAAAPKSSHQQVVGINSSSSSRRQMRKMLPTFSTVKYAPSASGLGPVSSSSPVSPRPAVPPAPPSQQQPTQPQHKDAPSVVILILSARSARPRRDAIRASWSKGSSNVYFIVGERACEWPEDWRKPQMCELRDGVDPSTDPAGVAAHKQEGEAEQARLLSEAKFHNDLIMVPMADSHYDLPRKLKEAYRWALGSAPNAKWFVKGDDDMYCRYQQLTDHLVAQPDSGKTMRAGGFTRGAGVQRGGKRAAVKYKRSILPAFPSGPGHAVTRELAQWLVDNDDVKCRWNQVSSKLCPQKLEEYQGEDVSMGIWMEEAPWQATLLEDTRFAAAVASPPLPVPRKVNSPVVILILSARSARHRRDAIRASWSKGSSNVYFIVGERACEWPETWRKPWTCDLRRRVDPSTDPAGAAAHKQEGEAEQARLLSEAKFHNDLIMVPMVDSYRSLPRKLKEAYRWALGSAPNAKWFVKGDDDMYCRYQQLTDHLVAQPDSGKTMRAGGFTRGAGVQRSGKWAEVKYKRHKLPPFPSGSGHAVTRELAQWLVDNDDVKCRWNQVSSKLCPQKLEEYQGEDSSMGIWMEEAPWQANLVTDNRFVTHSGNCHDASKFVVGHQISGAKMRSCYASTGS